MAADDDLETAVLRITPTWLVPLSALRFTFARSSGPGGQNVNKVNSKAVMEAPLSELSIGADPAAIARLKRLAGSQLTVDDRIVIASEQSRSQHANRAACIEKLRNLLTRAAVRPRPRRPTRPSAASRKRRLDAKKRRGQIKRLRRDRPE